MHHTTEYDDASHLAELMDAVQPFPRCPCRPSLRPEAVAIGGHLDGQVGLVQELIHVQTSQRYLSGSGEAEGGVRHRINLGGNGSTIENCCIGILLLMLTSRDTRFMITHR